MKVKLKNENGEEVIVEAEAVQAETTEKVDSEAVQQIVENAIDSAVAKALEAKGEAIANTLKSATENTARKTEVKSAEAVKNDRETAEFIKAVVNNDTDKLKAMSTSTSDDSKAGYTVPTALLTEVLRLKETYGVARRDMRYIPFNGSGNTRDIPALSGSVATFWTDEGGEKAGTQGTFRKVKQELKKLAAIVALTDELIEDSAVDLTGLISELFAEAVAKEEDIAYFTGTGAPFTGILNATNTGAVANDVPTQTMPTGKTAFNQVTADDLLNLQYKVKPGARASGKYYVHPDIVATLMKLKDSNNQYIYAQPAGDKPATLWGKAVEEVEVLPDLTEETQAGKPFAIFGDLKQGCVYSDKGELRIKLLDQATIDDVGGNAINLAQRDMTAIRAVQRTTYSIVLPKAMAVLKTSAS